MEELDFPALTDCSWERPVNGKRRRLKVAETFRIDAKKMEISVLQALTEYRNVDDRESDEAFFRTRVPWCGEAAYLHIVFKPIEKKTLLEASARLSIPPVLSRFFSLQNGAILFAGAISIYGVHSPGQKLRRTDPLFALPFNLETENSNWPPSDPYRFLTVGGYGFDGSRVCIDRITDQMFLFQRGEHALLSTPSKSWPSFEQWLQNEIARLALLFDSTGRRLVDEGLTIPDLNLPS